MSSSTSGLFRRLNEIIEPMSFGVAPLPVVSEDLSLLRIDPSYTISVKGGHSEIVAKGTYREKAVAIKTLHTSFAFINNIAQEIVMHAHAEQLGSAVKLEGVFVDHNRIHLAMEWYNKGSLEEYLPKLRNIHPKGRSDPRRVQHYLFKIIKEIALPLAKQLNALHKVGILHGDIKVANVLIQQDEKAHEVTAKLADFGCAFAPGRLLGQGFYVLSQSTISVALRKGLFGARLCEQFDKPQTVGRVEEYDTIVSVEPKWTQQMDEVCLKVATMIFNYLTEDEFRIDERAVYAIGAPEAIRVGESYDTRSEAFVFGLLLISLWTLQKISHTYPTLKDYLECIVKPNAISHFTRFAPVMPDEYLAIINKICRFEPGSRLTFNEIENELTMLLINASRLLTHLPKKPPELSFKARWTELVCQGWTQETLVELGAMIKMHGAFLPQKFVNPRGKVQLVMEKAIRLGFYDFAILLETYLPGMSRYADKVCDHSSLEFRHFLQSDSGYDESFRANFFAVHRNKMNSMIKTEDAKKTSFNILKTT